MVKNEYFCDRCKKDVTNIGAQFALGPITVSRHSGNALKVDVCRDCSREIEKFILAGLPTEPAEGREPEP